jgi:hypothetical protein
LLQSISKFLSVVFHPLFLSLGLFLIIYLGAPQILLFQFLDVKVLKALFILLFIYALAFPLLMVFVMKRMGLVHSYLEPERNDRRRLLIMIMGIYLALAYFLNSKGTLLQPAGKLIFFYCIQLVLLYLFNFFYKISIHVWVLSAIIGLFYVFYIYSQNQEIFRLMLLFIVLTGLLCSSRLILRAHTEPEVYLAIPLGLISGALCSFLLFFR